MSVVAFALHAVIAIQYHHTFSAAHPVVKRIEPGDAIETKTVDSAGFDLERVRRTRTHGNPLTGPFYIEGAEAGDALVVHIERLRLNRDSGYTGHAVGLKDLPPHLLGPKPAPDAAIKGYDYLVPWKIDRASQTVSLASNPAFRFAAQPMLGCIGVAPEGDYAPRSGPAGYWGGNLDYNRIREGASVILPVYHPGGLLFFGDGHALQGDGEAVGSGVETSLDVRVRVELRKRARLTGPRLETADSYISIGAKPEATLNESLRLATLDMLRWLIEERKVPAAEAHLLIGLRARYDVLTVGGYVGLRLPK